MIKDKSISIESELKELVADCQAELDKCKWPENEIDCYSSFFEGVKQLINGDK